MDIRRFVSIINTQKDRMYTGVQTSENSSAFTDVFTEELSFKSSTRCHICNDLFSVTTIKVRDHCHVSGKYRGAACQSCNLYYKQPNFIPVIFHNLKNFDSHIVCESLGHFKNYEIKCIAQNSVKYVSFSLGNLRFIDSYQFLGSSLETLVKPTVVPYTLIS